MQLLPVFVVTRVALQGAAQHFWCHVVKGAYNNRTTVQVAVKLARGDAQSTQRTASCTCHLTTMSTASGGVAQTSSMTFTVLLTPSAESADYSSAARLLPIQGMPHGPLRMHISPTRVTAGSSLRLTARPKSAILSTMLLPKRTFSGLMSLHGGSTIDQKSKHQSEWSCSMLNQTSLLSRCTCHDRHGFLFQR